MLKGDGLRDQSTCQPATASICCIGRNYPAPPPGGSGEGPSACGWGPLERGRKRAWSGACGRPRAQDESGDGMKLFQPPLRKRLAPAGPPLAGFLRPTIRSRMRRAAR
jgi:hypothetical protein